MGAIINCCAISGSGSSLSIGVQGPPGPPGPPGPGSGSLTISGLIAMLQSKCSTSLFKVEFFSDSDPA